MPESKQWIDENGTVRTFKDETARNGLANKVSSISVNGTPQTMDSNKNVDITVPSAPIQSISLNGSTVSPDGNGNVALTVITNAVNDLINYYNKYVSGGTKSTSTYSAEEIDQMISTIPKFDIKIVASLPTGLDISTTTIYLVAATTTGTNNIYTEYVYVNNGWEKLGEQTLAITVDNALSSSSTNPVQNSAIYTAVHATKPVSEGGTGATDASGARTNLGLGTAAVANTTTSITSGGTGLPTAGAVYTALENAGSIETTTTDPGEGATMTSDLLIVYEE